VARVKGLACGARKGVVKKRRPLVHGPGAEQKGWRENGCSASRDDVTMPDGRWTDAADDVVVAKAEEPALSDIDLGGVHDHGGKDGGIVKSALKGERSFVEIDRLRHGGAAGLNEPKGSGGDRGGETDERDAASCGAAKDALQHRRDSGSDRCGIDRGVACANPLDVEHHVHCYAAVGELCAEAVDQGSGGGVSPPGFTLGGGECVAPACGH
jgi:hypothetical protein